MYDGRGKVAYIQPVFYLLHWDVCFNMISFNHVIMTKWPVQKLTHKTTQKHVHHHDAIDIKKNFIFVFFGFLCFIFFFIDNFLNEFSNKCWVTALVRSMTFIREFKPVFRYSKPVKLFFICGHIKSCIC